MPVFFQLFNATLLVMPRLGLGIHESVATELVDGQAKLGHDERERGSER
jgi:hypothetical protein